METRSNHVLVGAVAIVLFVAAFLFILWIARIDTSDRQQFDIFFPSVSGIARGSAVNYSGVPVGKVQEIRLLPDTPEFVRVRIDIDQDVPILQGTVATIAGVGFTGVSLIELEGAIKGAPPIDEPGPFGVPVIPTKPGTIGQLLDSAPQLIERVNTLVARFNAILDPENQESLKAILNNTERVSGALASRSTDITETLVAARKAVDSVAELAANTNALVGEEGRPLAASLRKTLERADTTLAELEKTSKAARGGLETLNGSTLPEVNQLVGDLREISRSMGTIAAKLDEDPAGALVGGRKLPEYKPAGDGQ